MNRLHAFALALLLAQFPGMQAHAQAPKDGAACEGEIQAVSAAPHMAVFEHECRLGAKQSPETLDREAFLERCRLAAGFLEKTVGNPTEKYVSLHMEEKRIAREKLLPRLSEEIGRMRQAKQSPAALESLRNRLNAVVAAQDLHAQSHTYPANGSGSHGVSKSAGSIGKAKK